MNYRELIDKLREYPPDEILRVYCPVDKNYYYVYDVVASFYGSFTIIITSNHSTQFTTGNLISELQSYIKWFPAASKGEVFFRTRCGGKFAICDTQQTAHCDS
jgi:hypothetical protein